MLIRCSRVSKNLKQRHPCTLIEWMHACMHACMNEWMNEWMNECTHARTHARTHEGRKEGRKEGMNEWMKVSSVLMFISKLPNWDVMSDSDFSSPDAESLSISPFLWCISFFPFRSINICDTQAIVGSDCYRFVPWAAIGIEFVRKPILPVSWSSSHCLCFMFRSGCVSQRWEINSS